MIEYLMDHSELVRLIISLIDRDNLNRSIVIQSDNLSNLTQLNV
jgi:hypothetical protein